MQKVSQEDQKLMKNFLASFGFLKRQQLIIILLGFPKKLNLFIDLIKKKQVLAENYNLLLAKEVLNLVKGSYPIG